MKRSELKNLIKECVKEILFEEGVLSNLVAEVAFGITKAQTQLVEQSPPAASDNFLKENAAQADAEKKKRLLETKKKMVNAIGGDRMKGVFEGTEPLRSSGGSPAHSPMSGKDPSDAGVDISGLFGLAGQKWKQLK